MTKTVMSARVTDQHLTLVNVPLIASGGVDEIRIHFQFCGLWDGCGKTAVFYRDPGEVYHVPVADGSVIVPHEVLAEEGFFYFGVMGTGDNIRTSEVVRIYVTQGAITTATANHEELTPDIYQQILAAYGKMDSALAREKAAREAETAEERADRKAEIAVERARIDTLVAMRSDSGETVYEFTAGELSVTITTNGINAYVTVLATGDFELGKFVYCDIPEFLSPLGEPLYIAEGEFGTVSVYYSNIRYWARTGFTGSEVLAGTYPLKYPTISELSDIRTGANGEVNTCAGAAVRSQVAVLNNKITEENQKQANDLIESLCPTFTEKGGMVRCEPVKGYPINVRSYFGAHPNDPGGYYPYDQEDFDVTLTLCGKNLYDRERYPMVEGRYVTISGKLSGYSKDSNYVATENFIPVSHLRGKQITLNHPPVETLGGNPRMMFYTAANEGGVISGSGGNGYTHTVPQTAEYMRFSVPKAYKDGTQIQIELGTMVTAFEAYRSPEVFVASPPPTEYFYQGYFDWSTGELYSTHDLMEGQPETLKEKPTPVLVATTDPTVILPEGSSTVYSTNGDTEVSGRANPGALIDLLTRKFEAISATTAAVPVVGGDL